MAKNKGKSGGKDKPINPFEQQDQNKEKSWKKKRDFNKKIRKKIDKEISKDKRQDLKKNLNDTASDSELPTPDHEERYKEDLEPSDEGLDLDEVSGQPVTEPDEITEPINPFEAASAPAHTIEKKALGDKPLDRKDKEFKSKDEFATEADRTPEEVEQADEKMDTASETEVQQADAAQAEQEQAPEFVQEAGVAEVVDEQHEPIGGHVEPAEAVQAVAEKTDREEFKEEFWDILEQAGLTKKRIITIAIILFVVIFGLIIFFSCDFGGDEGAEKVEEIGETVDEIPDSEVEPGEAYSIVTSYIFGLEYTVPVTPIEAVPIGEWGNIAGIEAGLIFGGITESFEDRYVYYIEILRRMDNMYYTDIYALLDMSVDRRVALGKHIDELSALIEEAEFALEEIDLAMERFDQEYEILADNRDLYESQFFEATENLYGQTSYDNLKSFIDISQQADEIKAYYNAYLTAKDYYILYLESLYPRLEDIVANEEALIKGIRVFDIPSSDIDAIILIEEE
jgi:hypothetical protein